LASAETDPRKRGDYGALALVFAELAGCDSVWEQALKEWNMQESKQVLKWLSEGEARGEARGEVRGALRTRREDLRTLLEDRFGTLPAELLQRIEAMDDGERLRSALRQVVKLQSPEELQL
jgi:hypothetical protein